MNVFFCLQKGGSFGVWSDNSAHHHHGGGGLGSGGGGGSGVGGGQAGQTTGAWGAGSPPPGQVGAGGGSGGGKWGGAAASGAGNGLVHWMSVMAEHINTTPTPHSDGVHYMWNQVRTLALINFYNPLILIYPFLTIRLKNLYLVFTKCSINLTEEEIQKQENYYLVDT